MSASSSSRRSLASRRRSSGGGTKLLGAVKLHSPLGGASDAGSPCSTASDTSALTTPQDRSPLIVSRAAATAPGAAAAPAAADALAQFGQQLSASRSSDRWLAERLAFPGSSASAGGTRRPHASSASASSPGVVEPAAVQIVHKTLRFITGDQTPPPPGGVPPPRKVATAFDSQSFLDKGMDAISGVGKLMEGFALTLDSVIGQAFEDWGPTTTTTTSKPRGITKAATLMQRSTSIADGTSSGSGSVLMPKQQGAVSQAGATPAGWQDFSIDGKENNSVAAAAAPFSRVAGAKTGCGAATASTRQAHMTSFMSKLDAASEQEVQEWRKRAQQLAGELQRVRAQQEEYQRLRLQYEKLQSELATAASQASRLAEENSALRSASPAARPVTDPALGPDPDPLAAQQVARQMEALLSEKSRLVAENDRLLRENNGLQELLEFSLVHQAQWAADGDLFDQPEEERGMPLVSPAQHVAAVQQPCSGHAAAVAAATASTGRQQRLTIAAGLGGGNSLKNKYKSRQELEQGYFADWNALSRAALQEGKQPMTPWTLLAALPHMIRYYVIPAPLRFLVFLVVHVAKVTAQRLRKLAVLTGAKLDVATLQRRGTAGSYRMRQTALRRLHGKESLWGPLQLMMGR